MKVYDNFEQFFGSLLVGCVELEGFYLILKNQDVDPLDWPDCTARRIAIQFFKIAKTKGERAAAVLIQKSIADIPRLVKKNSEIDERFVAANYHGFLHHGLAIELGRKILSNPQKVNSLIEEFQSSSKSKVEVVDIRANANKFISQLEVTRLEKTDIFTIPGFSETAHAFGGFNPGRLWIITAATGVGKTNLSLNLAYRSSEARSTLFVNMEMDLHDLEIRLMQGICGQERSRIFNSDDSTFKASGSLYVSSMFNRQELLFTSGKSLSLTEILVLIRIEARERRVKQIFIDYDQKVFVDDPRDEWRVLQVVAESLEELAKECSLNIVLLSQADENGDPKASKRMKQSAAAVLHFKEENGVFLLEAKKNRFGRFGEKVFFDYKPEIGKCLEINSIVARELQKNRRANERAPISL